MQNFLDNLIIKGLEHFRSFYGIYRAIVFSNKDPEKRGRIQVSIPDVGQSGPLDLWVDPLFDYAGANVGMFFPPEEQSLVRVFFNLGNPSTPMGYLGGWYSDKTPLNPALGYDDGDDSAPIKRGIVTKAGHKLVFNDKAGSEEVRVEWSTADGKKGSSLKFEPNGDVLITNANGSLLHFDAENKQMKWADENGNSILTDKNGITAKDKSGNSVKMDGSKVTIDSTGTVVLSGSLTDIQTTQTNLSGSSDNVPLGNALINWLSSHVHGSGCGPTTPATQPAIPAVLLSQKVKIS